MSLLSWLRSACRNLPQGTSRARVMPPPSLITERPPPPEPLELTRKMMIRPKKRDWSHANALLDHTPGCRCSTCRLTADLRRAIRNQEGLP